MESIPRRAREETTDTTKTTEEKQPSLISSLAPPVSAEPPKKKPAFPPRKLSPVPPSQNPAALQISQQSTSIKADIMNAASSKGALSQGENRTMLNLDKYIDVVSSAIKKKKEKSSTGNSVLDRINDGNRREGGKRGGGVDLFGTFQSTSNRLNYFTTDPKSPSFGQIPPLPNTKLPIFPEDFPPNGPKEHKLSWWGIVEPSPDLLAVHEKVAEEVGYPIGKRKRGDTAALPGSDKKDDKKIKSDDDGKNESRDRSRSSRHSRDRDERRGRDERRSSDRDRRSNDRRRW